MRDKHSEAFVQEAAELIEILESSLLELENQPDNSDLIGKIFRSLHTIKGSGGMFGFDDVAAFVHDIETVYDRVRNDEIKVTVKLIDLTLQACDKIKLMIKKESSPLLKDGSFEIILSSFKEFLKPEEKTTSPAEKAPVIKNEPGAKIVYHILFETNEDLFLKGTKPNGLLRELSELGEAFILPITEKIPLLDELEPEKLYVSWNIILSTTSGINSVKDVFIFVDDDCKVTISEIDNGELNGNAEYYLELIGTSKPKIKAPKPIHKNESPAELPKSKKETTVRQPEPEGISSIRVRSDKLDVLINLVGELVTVQARLTELAAANHSSEFITVAEDVERLTWELRENALSIRMLPISSTFNKFNRLVRDLSKDLGKDVELITEGGETEIDKNVIEKLNDPLVHIIRNCIDHGLEMPEVRVSKNKNRAGKVSITAMHSGTHVLIKISDDGAGLDKKAIQKKAVEKGIISAETELNDKEIYQLIFKAGFSTAKNITNVSGRGVGMDVVKSAIESLRGTVDVESEIDKGTTISLRLPLTLAIIEGLIVRIDEEYFVVPLSFVEECIELTSEAKEKTHGRNLIGVRGEIIPYIPLRDRFHFHNNRPKIEQIVIINENHSKTGIVVDEIIGEHQTVIKTLGKYYRNIEVMSGATVLGDGTVALIIDVPKLISSEVLREGVLIG